MNAELRETDRALLAFLRARLDEDEAVASAAADKHGQTWSNDGEYLHVLDIGGDRPIAVNPWGGHSGPLGPHIARHDPKRELAEVAAKRRIIQECAYWLEHDPLGTGVSGGLAAKTLRLLALPYAGHPGYLKEWAPDE